MSLNGEVSFSFNLVDNVTPASDRMSAAQEKLTSKAKMTTDAFDEQRIKNIETLASLNAFRSGIRQMTSSMHELGIVDDATYTSLNKVVAGITLVTSTAEAIKGLVAIMKLLRTATATNAVAAVFAAFAENPLLGAATFAGAGIAAGYMVSSLNQSTGSVSNSTTNNSTSINVYGTPSSGQRIVSQGLSVGSYYQG